MTEAIKKPNPLHVKGTWILVLVIFVINIIPAMRIYDSDPAIGGVLAVGHYAETFGFVLFYWILAAVITSSPGFKLIAFKDNFNASVPELTPIAYFAPINLAKFFSKTCKGFPKVKSPVGTNLFNLTQRSLTFLNSSGR